MTAEKTYGKEYISRNTNLRIPKGIAPEDNAAKEQGDSYGQRFTGKDLLVNLASGRSSGRMQEEEEEQPNSGGTDYSPESRAHTVWKSWEERRRDLSLACIKGTA